VVSPLRILEAPVAALTRNLCRVSRGKGPRSPSVVGLDTLTQGITFSPPGIEPPYAGCPDRSLVTTTRGQTVALDPHGTFVKH
jgi:hypothetical protein